MVTANSSTSQLIFFITQDGSELVVSSFKCFFLVFSMVGWRIQ